MKKTKAQRSVKVASIRTHGNMLDCSTAVCTTVRYRTVLQSFLGGDKCADVSSIIRTEACGRRRGRKVGSRQLEEEGGGGVQVWGSRGGQVDLARSVGVTQRFQDGC